MNEFRESLLMIITTPIYAIVIGVEILYSYFHKRQLYSTKGVLANLYLTSLNFILEFVLRAFCLLVLNYFYQYHFFEIKNVYAYWIVLLLAEDFMFYWLHRIDHFCRMFWAVHVTHHNSEEFNLTVGFRSSVFQPLYRYVYYIPIALMGFRGVDIMFMYAATQIYGILVHTQAVKKLGFLEHILVTPSHHRVHHASNVKYLDKNMGMMLIIWDKLFGTFQAEDKEHPVKYGLTTNINTYNPITMVFHEWKNIFNDLKKPTSFKNKLKYIFGPPGWSHDGSTKTSAQLRAEMKSKSST